MTRQNHYNRKLIKNKQCIRGKWKMSQYNLKEMEQKKKKKEDETLQDTLQD